MLTTFSGTVGGQVRQVLLYYPPIYVKVSPVVSFPPVSPPRPHTPPSPHPHAPHAQPISFFSILSPAQYWVRSTNHLAPRYTISSISPLPFMRQCVKILYSRTGHAYEPDARALHVGYLRLKTHTQNL